MVKGIYIYQEVDAANDNVEIVSKYNESKKIKEEDLLNPLNLTNYLFDLIHFHPQDKSSKFQSVKTRSSRCCPIIEKRFGSREGFISHLTLERPCLPCSGQHSTNVRKWQELQREHWNLNELVSRVVIERPNRG